VHLSSLTPDDVHVELYLGRVAADGEIAAAQVTPMLPSGPDGKNRYLFEAAAVPCRHSGLHGYTVRVVPGHPDLATRFLPGLITWAGPDVKAS
jgi:starch phosphorylase